jgi:hypothetical protein
VIDDEPVQTKVMHHLLEFLRVTGFPDVAVYAELVALHEIPLLVRGSESAPESQGSAHRVSPTHSGIAALRRKLNGRRGISSQIGFDAIEEFREGPPIPSGPRSDAHS